MSALVNKDPQAAVSMPALVNKDLLTAVCLHLWTRPFRLQSPCLHLWTRTHRLQSLHLWTKTRRLQSLSALVNKDPQAAISTPALAFLWRTRIDLYFRLSFSSNKNTFSLWFVSLPHMIPTSKTSGLFKLLWLWDRSSLSAPSSPGDTLRINVVTASAVTFPLAGERECLPTRKSSLEARLPGVCL